MPRPQFSLKTLLWLMVVVAAFLAAVSLPGRPREPPSGGIISVTYPSGKRDETMFMPDGTEWHRTVEPQAD